MCFRKVFEVNWKIKKNFIMLLPIFIFLSPFRFPSAAFIKQNASVQFYCITINFYFWMFVAYFILWYLFSNIAGWLIFILLIPLCSNFWSGSSLSVFFLNFVCILLWLKILLWNFSERSSTLHVSYLVPPYYQYSTRENVQSMTNSWQKKTLDNIKNWTNKSKKKTILNYSRWKHSSRKTKIGKVLQSRTYLFVAIN